MTVTTEAAYLVFTFFSILVCMALGRRFGRELAAGAEQASIMDSAVFALFGLLLAFTFSSASARFDQRRQLIIQEANVMGTVYDFFQLIRNDAPRSDHLKELLQEYVKNQLTIYNVFNTEKTYSDNLEDTYHLQQAIWQISGELTAQSPRAELSSSFLSALENMFAVTRERMALSQIHMVPIIYIVLSIVSLAAAMLAGYNMAKKPKHVSLFQVLAFSGIITLAFFLIIELDNPRKGIIRINNQDIYLQKVLDTIV